MIEVKKKYIYDLSSLESYYGMLPLDVYISLSFFNHSNEHDYANILIDIPQIVNFVTECIIELFLCDIPVRLRDFEPTTRDFYFAAMPMVGQNKPVKAMVIVWKDKKFLITEINNSGNPFKMKNLNKEEMLTTMLSAHNYAVLFVSETIKKCQSSKKLSLVGIDEKSDEESEKLENKFDLNNYEKI